MKRLLIVDDEHHIVNWLVNLFENQTELELDILKAYTGFEALKIMENTKIDVVLLDIKMPGINGLEVSEKIIQRWPGLRIIFLTGYDNFDYIYYANRHKHIDYLLKTEEDAVILQAVKNVITSLDTEISTSEIMNQASARDELLQYYFQREYLKDLTLGKNIRESLENIKWQDGKKPDAAKPIILLYGKFSTSDERGYTAEQNLRILSLTQLMEKCLSQGFCFTVLEFEQNTVLWFIQAEESYYRNISLSPVLYVKEYLDEMTASWKELTGMEILLLLYYRELDWTEVPKRMPLLSQYALTIQPAPFIHSVAVYLDEKTEMQLLSSSNNAVILTNKWEIHLSTLALYLEQGEKQRFLHLLRQLVFEGKQIKSMHYLPLIGIYQHISSMLIFYINQHGLSEQLAIKTGLYPLYYISDFTTWEEAFSFLITIAEYIFDLGKDNQTGKNRQTVDIIKAYINDHLAEDLSLSSLSNLVNYNSSYVSRLFRQTTGIILFDYINQRRINKAKEYLAHSSLPINLIAKKTGFDTPQYFSLVFRKATGKTPKEYRSQSEQFD